MPLVATIHATEAGRHQGWLPSQLSRSIHSVEWWLTHEARRVIACSAHMRWEVTRLFGLPETASTSSPTASTWRVVADPRRQAEARADYAPGVPLVVFAGRLEWEKGVHTLLDAMPRLRRRVPGLDWSSWPAPAAMAEELRRQADRLRLGRALTFTGWLPEDELHALVAAADLAVVPSLYEPFGLVALEAAALGTPLVVARTGGLAEIVRTARPGRRSPRATPRRWPDAVEAALLDPCRCHVDARGPHVSVLEADHGWARIADRTVHTYESSPRPRGCDRAARWRPRSRRARALLPRRQPAARRAPALRLPAPPVRPRRLRASCGRCPPGPAARVLGGIDLDAGP